MANMYSNQQSNNHLPPIWRAKPENVKHLRLYRNGDEFYPGKSVALNQKQFRTFESWLSDLSNNMRLTHGAVRRVYTPTNGTRCDNFDSLQEGQSLVLAGQEKFKKLRYDQIISHERKKSPPYKYDANPVVHSRIFQCSGKIRKIENSSIIIKVWPNGGEKRTRRPRVVLLRRTAGWNMSQVLTIVNDMLKDDCNGSVEAMYTRNGSKMADVDALEHNGVYVALTKRDRFKRASYPDFATKDLHTSPRPDRKMLDPLYSRSNNSTSHSSPEHSNASSSQNVSVNGHRRRPPKREEDQVFPAKPVKHNRSFDKTKKVDLDKDEGGMFKAKNSNAHTRGAREVNDTRQTKTDLPIDQQKAREVDEDIKDDHYSQYSKQPHPRSNNSNGYGGQTEAKSNSRRQPPRVAAAPKKKPAHNNDNNKQEKKYDEDLIRDIKARREQSAIKIQAGYRGFKTRKELSSKKKQKRKSPTPAPPKARSPSPSPRVESQRNLRRQLSNTNSLGEPMKTPSPPPAYNFKEEEKAATQIQAGYRGFAARKQIEAKKAANKEVQNGRNELEEYESIAKQEANKLIDNANSNLYQEEEKAATKIQAGFRGFQSRKEFETRKAQNEIQSRNREEEIAATKIQAGFRGHKARSSMRQKNDDDNEKPKEEVKSPAEPKPAPPPPAYDDDDIDEDEDDFDKAAIKIQAGFRGYQARKKLGRI